MSTENSPACAVTDSLGYLLKHAHLQLAKYLDTALAPLSIDKREFMVLNVISGPQPLSQLEASQRLHLDRTTMVAVLDSLEDKGLLSRHPAAEDRRRNVIEITDTGRQLFARAVVVHDEAEQKFLADVDPRDVRRVHHVLKTIVERELAEDA